MCDVRLNDNIKRTSGINLEGPSLIRRSQKVWDPPKNGPIACICYLSTYSGSVASCVWVLALALISFLLQTEQTEPHLEVVLKSTRFC